MTTKKVGVFRFPGTNCDRDVFKAVENVGKTPVWLWHNDRFNPKDFDAFMIPGGFSYGDYLRAGALAARSPAMLDLKKAADSGKPVLGICNGFQILCELTLLPGALLKNENQRFIDRWVTLISRNRSPYFAQNSAPKVKLPIAHGQGRFYCDSETLKKLYDEDQIWWTYEENPNGSLENIAGVLNQQKNVAALMPHPERAMTDWMGSEEGQGFFL
ncbi:MAG: phosphoribosylformylglycinamidine synthase subunit PurQ [Bdellovibrionales bacterium]